MYVILFGHGSTQGLGGTAYPHGSKPSICLAIQGLAATRRCATGSYSEAHP